MTEFMIDIWLFVERKFETLIPPYIKNVLKYCGYEDCHSIATIEENDLEYFTTEVRKGGITNFFTKTGTENALNGSNKSEENFEFRRGHQKLLMAIVKFVKENLKENGVDAFSVKLPKPKENLNISAQTTRKPRNKIKDIFTSTLKESELTLEFTRKDSEDFFHEDLINLQATLLKQTIRSLFTHSPEMYDKNMEFVGTKVCNGLVYITAEKPLYSAEIKCPYCAENISVSPILNESLWNTANFDSHLTILHNESDENFGNSTIKIVVPKLISKTDSDFHCDSNQDVKVETIFKVPTITNCNCLPSLPPIVGCSDCDTNIEDEERRSIHFFGMSEELNKDKVVGQKTHTLASVKPLSTRISTETLLDNDKTDSDVVANEEDYVICSVTTESSMKWPDCVPKAAYVVGQIIRHNSLAKGEIKLQILKRDHDSKFIFVCVKKDGIQVISVKNVIKILEVPTRNRRNKLVFKDKSLLNYNI